jgi:AGCS family alanine or glycine:cation symporter
MIDDAIDAAFRPLAKALSDIVFLAIPIGDAELPWIVAWLIAGAVFFTVYLRFINLRGMRHAVRIVRGDFSDASSPGELTPFQALTTAISGTVGVGNIAHVAIAVSVGGPGALFWLVVAGFLGMSTKFAECMLGSATGRSTPTASSPADRCTPCARGWRSVAGRAWAAVSPATTPSASWSGPWASVACSSRTRPTCSWSA